MKNLRISLLLAIMTLVFYAANAQQSEKELKRIFPKRLLERRVGKPRNLKRRAIRLRLVLFQWKNKLKEPGCANMRPTIPDIHCIS